MRVWVCLVIFLVVALAVRAQGRSHDTLTVHFVFDQHQLRQEEAARLDDFLRRVDAATDTLFISGYTDTVGSADYNKRLSMRRAQEVAGRIRARAESDTGARPRLVMTAAGESEQVEGGDSANRRVVVIRSYPGVTGKTAGAKEGDTAANKAAAGQRDTAADKAAAAGTPDSVVTLKDINFYEDQAVLTESSRMFLPHYITLLRQYGSDSIEVDGYCNSTQPITDPGDPLFKLSVKRAKLIYDILVGEGFDPSHLSYKGMGNARSRYAHPVTAEEMQANMRVEVLIYYKRRGGNYR